MEFLLILCALAYALHLYRNEQAAEAAAHAHGHDHAEHHHNPAAEAAAEVRATRLQLIFWIATLVILGIILIVGIINLASGSYEFGALTVITAIGALIYAFSHRNFQELETMWKILMVAIGSILSVVLVFARPNAYHTIVVVLFAMFFIYVIRDERAKRHEHHAQEEAEQEEQRLAEEERLRHAENERLFRIDVDGPTDETTVPPAPHGHGENAEHAHHGINRGTNETLGITGICSMAVTTVIMLIIFAFIGGYHWLNKKGDTVRHTHHNGPFVPVRTYTVQIDDKHPVLIPFIVAPDDSGLQMNSVDGRSYLVAQAYGKGRSTVWSGYLPKEQIVISRQATGFSLIALPGQRVSVRCVVTKPRY